MLACAGADEDDLHRASLLPGFDDHGAAGRRAVVEEPGVDEHLWISRYESLEEDIRTSPAESLSDLDELVSEMMEARGMPLAEREGEEIDEPETIRQFTEARRVTRQVDAGEEYDPGDVANAVDAYRSLYDYLLNLGATPGAPA
jgi:hypothetical protein